MLYFIFTCNNELISTANSILKTCFTLEQCLTNLKAKDRYILCKFRCSNFRIPIEVGRWRNIPRQDRKCELCDVNSVGDEYHYLSLCSNYQIKTLRGKYLPEYYTKNPTIQKLQGFLSFCNVPVLIKLWVFFFRRINKFFS